MAKIKRLTIPHVDECVEHLELSYIIGGIVNEHLVKDLGSFLFNNKQKSLPHNPAVPPWDIDTRENEEVGLQRDLRKDIQSYFIYNSQRGRTA